MRQRTLLFCSRPAFAALCLILSVADNYAQDAHEPPAAEINQLTLRVPAVTGTLTIDGSPDELFWKSSLPLPAPGKDPSGTEIRMALRGKYLCISAVVADSGDLVTHSAGFVARLWNEDMIVWRIFSASPLTGKNTSVAIAVNPFGGYCALEAENYYVAGRDNLYASKDQPVKWAKDMFAAGKITPGAWSVEAAIPLEQLGSFGFLSVERIKAFRPETGEHRWFWPAANVLNPYVFEQANSEGTPAYSPPAFTANAPDSVADLPSSDLASVVASLPSRVWSDSQARSNKIRSMLDTAMRSQINIYSTAEKKAWQKIKSRPDWETFRDTRLAALRKWLGPMPDSSVLKTITTKKINYGDGFIIENILYGSLPDFPVPANLYLPEVVTGKIPAIILIHSLHFPKTQIELQEMGMTWAKSGTAVLVIDLPGAGERLQSQPWRREGYYGRYTLGNQLYLAGESLIKWMVWDIMKGVDLLTSRPEIDPGRIVLLGAVAGGGDPAAVAAALDQRIAAVIPFNFGKSGSVENMLQRGRTTEEPTADPGWAYWETSRNIPGSISDQFFPWFLCAAAAPRPQIYASESKWRYTVEEEIAWRRYKKIYGFYQASDRLDEVHGFTSFPGPGECNNVSVFHRRQIDPILNRWLKIQPPVAEYRRSIPESDLMCYTPEAYEKYPPRSAVSIAKSIAISRLNDSRKQWSPLEKPEQKAYLRKALQTKLGVIDPERPRKATSLWKKEYKAFSQEALTIVTETGITIPVLLLWPENGAARIPAVIAIAQGGKENFLRWRSNEIADLLQRGIALCLPDLRGVGEISGDSSRKPDGMDLAANELMIGTTLVGARLKDLRTVFRWLSGISGINAARIGIWGDTFSQPNDPELRIFQSQDQQPGPVVQRQAEPMGAFLAVLAAFYEDKLAVCAGRGLPVSFLSALDNKFCQLPQDVIVPGLLTVADLGDIVSTLEPGTTLLEKITDGLNREASVEQITTAYGQAIAGKSALSKANPKQLSRWLIEVLTNN